MAANNQEDLKSQALLFTQMEAHLTKQIQLCEHYKQMFESQNNATMATKFETYALNSTRDLELIRSCIKKSEVLPKWTFDHVSLNCVPINIDVKERELQLIVKTSNLPVAPNALVYIIAEFSFPQPRDGTIAQSLARWFHSVKIEPKKLLCCSQDDDTQLDIIYAVDTHSFLNQDAKSTEYDRPLSFYVDKGKSRTLKRKFKPVKLTIYEKTDFLKCDKKLGTLQVKIDDINDEKTIVTKISIMDGRKQTEAVADIEVRVREALVNKSIKSHEERLVILT